MAVAMTEMVSISLDGLDRLRSDEECEAVRPVRDPREEPVRTSCKRRVLLYTALALVILVLALLHDEGARESYDAKTSGALARRRLPSSRRPAEGGATVAAGGPGEEQRQSATHSVRGDGAAEARAGAGADAGASPEQAPAAPRAVPGPEGGAEDPQLAGAMPPPAVPDDEKREDSPGAADASAEGQAAQEERPADLAGARRPTMPLAGAGDERPADLAGAPPPGQPAPDVDETAEKKVQDAGQTHVAAQTWYAEEDGGHADAVSAPDDAGSAPSCATGGDCGSPEVPPGQGQVSAGEGNGGVEVQKGRVQVEGKGASALAWGASAPVFGAPATPLPGPAAVTDASSTTTTRALLATVAGDGPGDAAAAEVDCIETFEYTCGLSPCEVANAVSLMGVPVLFYHVAPCQGGAFKTLQCGCRPGKSCWDAQSKACVEAVQEKGEAATAA